MSASEDQQRIEVDRLDLLLSQLASVLVANVLNPCILWWIVGGRARMAWGAWVALQAALSGFRWWQRRSMRRRLHEGEARAVGQYLSALSLASGALWGMGAAFLIEETAASLLAWSFVVGGMVTAAAGTTAVHLPAFLSFAWAALLPLALRLYTLPAHTVGPMPALVALFALLMTAVARRTHQSLGHSFRLRHENSALVASLGAARTALWEANQDLEAKVRERTAELAEERARLAQRIDHAPDGLLTLVSGRVVAVNPALARMLAVAHDALVGMHLASLPGLDAAHAQSLLAECAREGHAQLDITFEPRPAEPRYLEIKARQAPEQADQIELAFRDVTERQLSVQRARLLEENAHRAARLEAIRRFSGGVAHEFNNLLAIILGTTERLLASDPGPALRSGLDDTHKAAVRGAKVTRELLSVSQRQRGTPEHVDLHEFVESQRPTVERLVGQQVSVSIERSGGELYVLADRSQLEEVLFHVLLYVTARPALHAHRDRIVLRTLSPAEAPHGPDMAVLSVTYESSGAEGEPLSSPSHNGDAALELTAARGLLVQHGGFLERVDHGPYGLTFMLGWPRAARESEPTRASPGATEQATGGAARGVLLVVDDEPALRDLVATMLREQGFEVLVASHAGEARAIAASTLGPIHGLITDVVMPGTDGPSLARELRATRPRLKVCFMSGYTAAYLGDTLERDPETTLLEKPFSMAALLQVAETLVERTAESEAT